MIPRGRQGFFSIKIVGSDAPHSPSRFEFEKKRANKAKKANRAKQASSGNSKNDSQIADPFGLSVLQSFFLCIATAKHNR
jgi:hypothetical protein